ncbi:MAG: molybdopterin-dependent oxidoreductase, partial [Acidobacteriota bacterium]
MRPAAGRRGGCGKNGLVAAPWEEALDRLAREVGGNGAEASQIVWLAPARRPRLREIYPRRAGALIGGRLTMVRRTDPRQLIAELLAAHLAPDERVSPETVTATSRTDLVLAWSFDPDAQPFSVQRRVREHAEAGGELLLIEPDASELSARSRWRLTPRPGTDTPLALALIGSILAAAPSRVRRLPAAGYEAPWSPWTLGRAAELCELDLGMLQRVAQRLAEAPSVQLVIGDGAASYAPARELIVALSWLARLCEARVVGPALARDPSSIPPAPPGEGRDGASSLASFLSGLDARDPRRDVILIEGGDPFVDWPGWSRLAQHLERARFVAVLAEESGPSNELAQLADLLVPIAGFLEQTDATALHDPSGLRWAQAAVRAPGRVRTAGELWRGLASRRGWPLEWFPEDLAALQELFSRDAAAAVPASSSRDSRAASPAGSAADAGRVEYREPAESPLAAPALYRSYPLHLVARRRWSAHRTPSDLPEAVLSPEDAQVRGIDGGQRVQVHNARGVVLARTRLSADQPRGRVTLCSDPRGQAGAVLLSGEAPHG